MKARGPELRGRVGLERDTRLHFSAVDTHSSHSGHDEGRAFSAL